MLKFKIDGAFYLKNCLPNYNDYILYCRTNKYSANNLKKRYQRIIAYFIPKGSKIKNKYKMNLVIGEVSHKRDKDNVEAFAKKLINDTLQEYGYVDNDNLYDGGETKFVYEEKAFIEVEIVEESDKKIVENIMEEKTNDKS